MKIFSIFIFMFSILGFFYIIYAFLCIVTPLDSTDKNHFNRSNFHLHIDNKTGCHYLTSWSGVIYPRLDKDGEHICSGYERNNK